MTGQTYEHGDPQEIPPLDDLIANLAQKLCDEYRIHLDQSCCNPARRPVLLALEDALITRRKGGVL